MATLPGSTVMLHESQGAAMMLNMYLSFAGFNGYISARCFIPPLMFKLHRLSVLHLS